MIIGANAAEVEGWSYAVQEVVQPLDDDALEGARQAALVIEATVGPWSLKRRRLEALARVGVQAVMTAATTATLAAQRRWAPQMALYGYDPFLVVARGQVQTVAASVQDAEEPWAKWAPGCQWVRVKDAIGQIFSREILPIINEAMAYKARSMTDETIDEGIRLGLNYPKGPMAWGDLWGWDRVYWGLRAMEHMYGPRFRPHPELCRMVGSVLGEEE